MWLLNVKSCVTKAWMTVYKTCTIVHEAMTKGWHFNKKSCMKTKGCLPMVMYQNKSWMNVHFSCSSIHSNILIIYRDEQLT